MQKMSKDQIGTIPTCLRPPEVAEILGISRATAYSLVNSDGFPCLTIGRRIVVPREAFMAWMKANTVTSNTIQETD